ncbi:HlyC/CorC family transporter [Candidatus Woesearchaeota archaeon]|nr:HlyC/CorC family transporter [Candidatus Woesearchaeota archaeon]
MQQILSYVIILFLLVLSALFSGLNLGIMSLNPFILKRKVDLGDPAAIKVYPIRKKGNQLLSTLLLGNVLVNSTLAIFLGSLIIGPVAVAISTLLIVVVGEIGPQAVFAKYALKVSAKLIWLVKIFIWILFPLNYPIALVLDKVLGGELPSVYSKKEIRLFIEQQYKFHEQYHKLPKPEIDQDEYEILKRGLLFSDKIVKEAMTPIKKTFFVEKHAVLESNLLKEIRSQAHSRIPVYDKINDKVVGILYSKDLISVLPERKMPVWKLMRKNAIFVKDSNKLDEILNLFRQKKTHIFIVLDSFGKATGIITLEDVLEEIVGEIIDEYDEIFETHEAHAEQTIQQPVKQEPVKENK